MSVLSTGDASPSENVRRLRVVVTTDAIHHEMERLCPDRLMRWGNCDFILNPDPGTECDYWIIFAGSRDRDHMYCARENTLFSTGEPPSKKIYPQRFYSQFYRVISTHAATPHPRVTVTALALPWHVGLKLGESRYLYGYDELKALRASPKQNNISVVCSNLRTKEGQRARLEFLDRLKRELGDDIIHYGRGFMPITDKFEAICPHRYHLVLENSRSEHYWTEKLADAYLGWAYPIYVGCPNLSDYFPAEGFTPVNPNDPTAALQIIREKLASPVTTEAEAALATCRDLVLNRYNIFARFASWAQKFHQPSAPRSTVSVRSHKAFRPFPRGYLYRLRQACHLEKRS